VFVWGPAALFALLVVSSNAVLYAWRARVLRAACADNEQLGVLNAAWAFAKECAALAAATALIPIGWGLARCRTGAVSRGPLILVHGWRLNCGSLWLLRRRLLRDGWGPVCCVEYRSANVNIEDAARQLRGMVERINAIDGRPIAAIGHGLGGLVLRYFVRRYPAPRVRRIVTLATPHRGTEVARILGRRGRQLQPGSKLLSAVNAADHVPQQFDVIAIYSTFDAVILPPSNGRYPGAFSIQVNDVGHHALLFSAKVYRLIAENLAAPLP
jgi:triacylglycerol esterase/lipase EstA (alpha/beta hydrolase family)